MRGSSTFDGKLTGNRQLVDRYNESKGKKKGGIKPALRGGPGTQPEALPSESGGHSSGEREPGGHDELKNVMDEHGHAASHHIWKTHQGYHSLTRHEDGHLHQADHASLDEAHEHGRTAMDEDTEHLGDMGPDDYEVAEEKEGEEERPSRRTSRVGEMG